jgi:hypothetical protein
MPRGGELSSFKVPGVRNLLHSCKKNTNPGGIVRGGNGNRRNWSMHKYTIDYMIVSHELLDRFQNFVIRQPFPYSDHSQLVGWIKINKITIKSSTNNSQELIFNLPKQFKWSQESWQKFISAVALQSWESKEMISDFENTDLGTSKDVDMAVNEWFWTLQRGNHYK